MTVSRVVSLFQSLGRVALVASALGLVAATAAHAEGTEAQRAACTPDALRLCSSEIPDVGRVKACMAANRSRLSPACLATFASAAPKPASPPPAAIVATRHRAAPVVVVRARRPIVVARHHDRIVRGAMIHDGRRHHAGHRMARFNRAMNIAARVMGGLQGACAGGAAPADLCSYQRYIPMGMMGGLMRP